MRFKKTKQKYTDKVHWVACINGGGGQMVKDKFYLIYPFGAGFILYRMFGIGRTMDKICHVRKFDSAKQIATLMEKG